MLDSVCKILREVKIFAHLHKKIFGVRYRLIQVNFLLFYFYFQILQNNADNVTQLHVPLVRSHQCETQRDSHIGNRRCLQRALQNEVLQFGIFVTLKAPSGLDHSIFRQVNDRSNARRFLDLQPCASAQTEKS